MAATRDHTSKPSTCGVKQGMCSGAAPAGGAQNISHEPRHTSTISSWVPLTPGKQRHTRQRRAPWKAAVPLCKPAPLIVMDKTQQPLSCPRPTPWCLAAPTMPPCLSHPFLTLVIAKCAGEKHVEGASAAGAAGVSCGGKQQLPLFYSLA